MPKISNTLAAKAKKLTKTASKTLILALIALVLGLSMPQVAFAEDDTNQGSNNTNTSDNTSSNSEQKPKTTRGELTGSGATEKPALGSSENDEEDDNCSLIVHDVEEVNLVAEISEIPVTVVNTCKTEREAQIIAHSEQPNLFEVTEFNSGIIPANASTIIMIPVHAKANGELSMQLSAQEKDDDGSITDIASWRLKVQSTREIGQAVALFTYALVGGLIVIGIYRTVKRIHSSVKKNSQNS